MKTVVGSFDSYSEAQAVFSELESQGFDRDDISIVARDDARDQHQTAASDAADSTDAGDMGSGAAKGAVTGGVIGGTAGLVAGMASLAIPGLGPIIAAGPIAAALTGAGVGAVAGGIIGALTNLGVHEDDAHYYAESVRRGGALVLVRAEDARAQLAADIMQQHNAVDIDQRAAEWRQAGWQGFDETATPYAGQEVGTSERETVIPVVEEELQVGKHEVERGRARVYTHTVEEPVEEQVQLREEQVQVQRRPVDRPATEQDLNAAKDTELEFRETAEEPVVNKEARVVEEVEVSKRAQEHTENIRDRVRRTEVDVDEEQRAATSRPSQDPHKPTDRPL